MGAFDTGTLWGGDISPLEDTLALLSFSPDTSRSTASSECITAAQPPLSTLTWPCVTSACKSLPRTLAISSDAVRPNMITSTSLARSTLFHFALPAGVLTNDPSESQLMVLPTA